MKSQAVLEPSDEGGYTAIVSVFSSSVSEGETRDEAVANIQEAIQVYLEPVDGDVRIAGDAEVIGIAVRARSRAGITSK